MLILFFGTKQFILMTHPFSFGLIPLALFSLRLRVAASAFGRRSRPMADEDSGTRQQRRGNYPIINVIATPSWGRGWGEANVKAGE
jgi:hypothetical protein